MPDFMSKNIERTFSEGLQSNEGNISWVRISNYFTHESDSLNQIALYWEVFPY